MKLELKHLAPYLPYGLKGYAEDIKLIDSITLHNVEFIIVEQPRAKPILRPLSDLTKDIEHNGDKFVPMYELFDMVHPRHKTNRNRYYLNDVPNYSLCSTYDCAMQFRVDKYETYRNTFDVMQKLFEWHFDVFGLIEAGIAIDINTINK